MQSYGYDSLYRLTSAKETAGETNTWAQDFQYDRYGNRTSFYQWINDSRTISTTPQIDPDTNRFTDLSTFSYDKNGNIISDKDQVTNQLRTFTFNGDNKQSEIKDASNHIVGKYYYDGEGKRVKKVTDTETTVFVYSSGKLVAEYSTATPPPNPTINYTATDMLGSPRVVTNALGNVVSRRDFMPFGEDVPVAAGNRGAVVDINAIAEMDSTGNLRTTALSYQATDSIRQRFTGYQKDTETSLDFAEARMYESRYGRFTAVDPLLASGKSANPQTFNRYAYVTNNPLIVTDPTGLDPWWKQKIKDKDGNPTGRFRYKESNGSPGDGWDMVNFKGGWYTMVPEWNDTGRTRYLYEGGGDDFGARYNRVQNMIVNAPCPPGISCGSRGQSAPSLDMSRNQPLRSVEGIARLAEAGSLIPGVGVPFAFIAAGIRAGQGNVTDSGIQLSMAIPFLADVGGVLKGARVANGIAEARALGLAGERAVGITGVKKAIQVEGRNLFPDAVDAELKFLTEVKNVKSLSFTRQLRDYATYAQREGFKFNLVTRPGTKLSGPLRQAINDGIIFHKPILPF